MTQSAGIADRASGYRLIYEPGGVPSWSELVGDLDGYIARWEARVAVAVESREILALWEILRHAKVIRKVRGEIEAHLAA